MITVKNRILTELCRAISRGERLTRKEWAHRLHTSYIYFCVVVIRNEKAYGLRQAIRHVRACNGQGVVQVIRDRRRGRIMVREVRIPFCALAEAGFDQLPELAFKVEKGRIILEPAAQTHGKAVPA